MIFISVKLQCYLLNHYLDYYCNISVRMPPSPSNSLYQMKLSYGSKYASNVDLRVMWKYYCMREGKVYLYLK